MRITSGRLKSKAHCPQCGYGPLDGFTHVAEPGEHPVRPSAGDLTLCLKCGTILAYKKGMRLRLATLAEQFYVHAKKPELVRIVDKKLKESV